MVNTIYTAGQAAYLDTFSGLIDCTVTHVIEPGHGQSATAGKIEVKINQAGGKGGYREGEIVTCPAADAVPVPQVRVRNGKLHVDINYTWQ